MKHMTQQRFLQTLDDLVATAQANMKFTYRHGEPDWDAILTDLMTARSWFGTPCKPEHYGKVIPTIKRLALALTLICAALPAMAQGCIGGPAGDMCRVQQFQQQRNEDYQRQQDNYNQTMRDLDTQRYRMQHQ